MYLSLRGNVNDRRNLMTCPQSYACVAGGDHHAPLNPGLAMTVLRVLNARITSCLQPDKLEHLNRLNDR